MFSTNSENEATGSNDRFFLYLQVVFSLAGFVLCGWLASGGKAQNLHPLPTFQGRLGQVGLQLCELATGMLSLVWFWCAVRKLKYVKKSATGAGSKSKTGWTTRQSIGAAIYVWAGTFSFGRSIFAFLFPSDSHAIQWAARLSHLGLIVGIPLIQAYGDKREKDESAPLQGAKEEASIGFGLLRHLTVLALAAGSLIVIRSAAKRYLPLHEHAAFSVGLVLIVCTVSVLFFKWKIDATDQAGSGSNFPLVWVWLYAAVFMLTMISPIPSHWKTMIFFGQMGVILFYLIALHSLKRRIYRLGHEGAFERARRLNRIVCHFPGYGSSLEGILLFNAGRYREARDAVRPLAFDRNGKPRLKSLELYTYCLALVNDGGEAEAQGLLEKAVNVEKPASSLQVALATCLLTQGKDFERARMLLQESLNDSTHSSSDHAKRIARYAWALAKCGRNGESEAAIQQSLAIASGLSHADSAGVHYFVGEAWIGLGEKTKARSAFDQAIALRPEGVTALSVQKAIKRMGGQWHNW